MNEDARPVSPSPDLADFALPEEVATLPEPARQAAIDTVRRLISSGASRDEALEKARAIASDWISQRAPGDQSAVTSDDAAIPDREAVETAESTESRITTKLRVGGARRS